MKNYLEYQSGDISFIVISEDWPFNNSLFNAFDDRIYSLENDEFEELTDTDNPQGIMAVCRMKEFREPSALSSLNSPIVAFDRISDPGNMGTMLRTAAWFGVEGVMLSPDCVDIYNPKVVRASAGSLSQLLYAQGEPDAFIQEVSNNGRPVLALELSEDAKPLNLIDEASRQNPVVIVGSEAHGLDKHLLKLSLQPVYIPTPSGKADKIESMNAAQALGIALYEVSRG